MYDVYIHPYHMHTYIYVQLYLKSLSSSIKEQCFSHTANSENNNKLHRQIYTYLKKHYCDLIHASCP